MIQYFSESEMTSIELKRWNNYKEQHKDTECYCYFITDFELGVGYDIIATTIELTDEEDLYELDKSNSLNITDTEKLSSII